LGTNTKAEGAPSGAAGHGATLYGRFAKHPEAAELAAEVARLLRRYAEEVVLRYRLCPFLKDLETGFGSLCVVLDDQLDVETGCRAVLEADSTIIHVVYPLVDEKPGPFERFASSVNDALKGRLEDVPVHATFHPALVGATDDPHRLVGLLRQAPDPFIQFIPGNIQTAGADVAGGPPAVANTDRLFESLRGAALTELLETLDDIRADRGRTYERLGASFATGH
jgi:hypothetical protein